MVCRSFAVHHQNTCLGIHQNLFIAGPPSFLRNPLVMLKTVLGFAGIPGGYSKDDVEGLKEVQQFVKTGAGYSTLQGTRPQVCC